MLIIRFSQAQFNETNVNVQLKARTMVATFTARQRFIRPHIGNETLFLYSINYAINRTM